MMTAAHLKMTHFIESRLKVFMLRPIICLLLLIVFGGSGFCSEPSFDTRINYRTGDPPMSVFSVDLDGDNAHDLAVANSDDDSILLNLANIEDSGCCIGLTGNIDSDPGDVVDIGDLTALIDYLFITFTIPGCMEEANVDGDQTGTVDIGDLTALIDYLFITFTPPAACHSPSWQIVFEDNFDGDALDTSNWTQVDSEPGQYSLTGNGELKIDGEADSDGPFFVYNTTIFGNYVRVTTKFRTTQNDPVQDDVDLGIYLNVDLALGNMYSLQLTSDPFEATRDYELSISKETDGNDVIVVLRVESMSGTMPQISADNDYILEGVNDNGTITFSVKDEGGTVLKSISVEDSSHSGGKIAFAGDSNIGTVGPQSIFFDYVKVEKYQ